MDTVPPPVRITCVGRALHQRRHPSRPSPRTRALIALAGLFCASVACGQDSVATTPGGNDAPAAHDTALQRTSYIVDVATVPTSWGRRMVVGPVLKASREEYNTDFRTNVLLGAAASGQSIGPITLASPGPQYAVWTSAGQGVHPTANALTGGRVTPTTFDRQFSVALADVSRIPGTNALPTNIVGARIGQVLSGEGADRRRLYVERTVALVSGQDPLAFGETASLSLGAVDASGVVFIRADSTGATHPLRIGGDNIVKVKLGSRVVAPSSAFAINFLLKELGGTATVGWDNPSTSTLLGSSSVPVVTPAAAPFLQVAADSFTSAISLDFKGEMRAMFSGENNAALASFRHTSVTSLRGNPFVSIAPEPSPNWIAATLATTGGGTDPLAVSLAPVNSINVFQLAPAGTLPGVAPDTPRLATLPPPNPSNPPLVGTGGFVLNPRGFAQFIGAADQFPFRGPAGPVGIGQTASGETLVAATASDPDSGEFIAVKRFAASGDTPTNNWTIAAFAGTAANLGSPILNGASGSEIGQLVADFPVAISSPAIDLLGNVYFVSRWRPAGTLEKPTGFFKAVRVGEGAAAAYRIELLLTTGQVVQGRNSATAYTITALRLADSNSIASGAFHAGQLIQTRMNPPGQSAPTTNAASPFAFGGAVVNATIEYSRGASGETYEAALYIGPQKTLIADLDDDGLVGFSDLNMVLSFFGQTAPGLPGDVDVDGDVDFVDLNIVLSFYGQSEP